MRVTLLITSFNSLSQVAYTYFKDLEFEVDVVYAINDDRMIEEVEWFKPDFILCPFLKRFVPREIFEKYDIYIVHPGILGDRGAYAIDNAIRLEKDEWGVTILKANGEFDGGDVVVSKNFKMRFASKASIYRDEVKATFYKMLDEFLEAIKAKKFKKPPVLPMHKRLTQSHRAIDWQRDTTKEIIKKINMSDSHPGVLDEILDMKCYLFGAWEEERLRGKPKEILAKRDGAICLGTIDGAIWISHLMELSRFKLPATYVLKDRLKGIKEHRLPIIFDKSYKTFYEISCDIEGEVAYLHFNFHNGAFRAEQCVRLKYAIEYLKEQVKVIVLMGGEQFFSNGINLNILEDSKKSGEDGWSNINAINDLIKSVIFSPEVVMVASVGKNAGAGGVFLATACDYVVAREDVVLNPHYKTIGLSGSEYHTYTLPKRVGEQKAKELLDRCLTISAKEGRKIRLVDEVFAIDEYEQKLKEFCKGLVSNSDRLDDYLWDKEDFLIENRDFIESKKEVEIKRMHPEFWNEDSKFHKLRYEFVYKICPLKTPKRLKFGR